MNRRRTRTRRRLIALAIIGLVVIGAHQIFGHYRDAARAALVLDAREEGMAAYDRGDYAAALSNLSYYIARHRRDAEALRAFADARSKVPVENNRHLEEATVLTRAALDLDPSDVEIMERLMLLYEQLNRRVECRETAAAILTDHPEHVEALRAKATAHYLDSNLQEAATFSARLIDADPDEVTWRVLYLQVMQDRGRPLRELLAKCDEWIDEHATDGRYQMLKAQLLASTGRRDEARRSALEAAQRGAQSQLVLQHMVALLDALRLHEPATKLLESTREQMPDEQWVHETSVRRMWQAGRIDDALAEINALTTADRQLGPGLLRWKSLLSMLQDDVDVAKDALQQLTDAADVQTDDRRRAADRAWAEALKVRVELGQTSWRDALSAYRQALALDPNDPVLHFMLGEAYVQVQEYHLAASSLQRTVRAEPGWSAAQRLYAQTLLRLGRHDEAGQIASQVLRNGEGDLDLYLLLGRAWLLAGTDPVEIDVRSAQDGRLLTLVELLEKLLEQHPTNPDVIELLAHAYIREGNAAAAAGLIELTLQRDGLDESLLMALARVSEQHGLDLEERIADLGWRQFGPSPELAALRARVLHQAGDVDAALELIEQSLGYADDDARVRAAFLASVNHPDTATALDHVLDRAGNDLEQITFVLSQPATWQDAALAHRAIEMLAQNLGQTSPRVALARATHLLQFKSDKPAAIANALVLVRDVLQRTPDSLDAMRLMAMLHMAGNQPDPQAAIRQLKRAIATYPRRADLYPQLIRLLQHQGDFTTAEQYLMHLGRMTGTDEGLRRTELALLESQGDFESIIHRLSNRVDVSGSIADRLTLVASLHRTGNHARAQQMLDSMLAEPEVNPAALSMGANLRAERGRENEGYELLHQYEQDMANGLSALLLGAYCQRIGRIEEAGQWFQLALERAPERPEVWQHAAGHLLATGSYRDARKTAEAGLRIDPDDLSLITVYVLSSIHIGGSDRRSAMALLDTLDCQAEALVATLRLFDRVATVRSPGKITEADLAEMRSLVEQYPGFKRAWRLAIQTHVHVGQVREAAWLARQATSRMPGQSEFAELATRLLLELGELPEALEMAQTWRSRSLHNVIEADIVIAALKLDLNQSRGSADQLRNHVPTILAQREAQPERVDLLIRVLVADQRFDQLRNVLRTIGQDEDERWLQLVLELSREADVRTAARLLELVEPPLTADENTIGVLMLAHHWTQLGARSGTARHFDRALQLCRQAAADREHAPLASLLEASIAEQRGEIDVAAERYRKVLEQQPDHWIALNNLAQILLMLGRDADEALSLTERAVSQRPGDPDVLDTHAQALLAVGRADAAEPVANRVLELRPESLGPLLTSARVLLAQNRREEANELYQRAVELIEHKATLSPGTRAAFEEVDRAFNGAHTGSTPLSRLNGQHETSRER